MDVSHHWFIICSLVGSLNKIPLSVAGILLFKVPTSLENSASIFFGKFSQSAWLNNINLFLCKPRKLLERAFFWLDDKNNCILQVFWLEYFSPEPKSGRDLSHDKSSICCISLHWLQIYWKFCALVICIREQMSSLYYFLTTWICNALHNVDFSWKMRRFVQEWQSDFKDRNKILLDCVERLVLFYWKKTLPLVYSLPVFYLGTEIFPCNISFSQRFCVLYDWLYVSRVEMKCTARTEQHRKMYARKRCLVTE